MKKAGRSQEPSAPAGLARDLGLLLAASPRCGIGWLVREAKVNKKKIKDIFLPLMTLVNESPKGTRRVFNSLSNHMGDGKERLG